jgi:nucleoside-diphosphate-sugar epimerase
MRVLVTGHDGYIGAVLVPLLQRAGHDVVGVDTGLFSGCRFHEQRARVESLRRDVRDLGVEDLRGFYAIIHLAAISGDSLADLNPRCTFEVNHLASLRLARCARQARVARFLYASSCSVYAASSPEAWLAEDAPLGPATPYAESKARAEEGIGRLADDGFCPTFLRIAAAYGVSPYLRGDLVLNDLVGRAATLGSIRLEGGAEAWWPLVHVEDVSSAFVAVLESPWELVHGQAFNVGRSEENYRLRQLADLVEEVVGGGPVRCVEDGGREPWSCRLDCRKLEGRLAGYRPRWTARGGIEELHRAHRAQGLQRAHLEAGRYLRQEHVLGLIDAGALNADLRWTDVAPRRAEGLRWPSGAGLRYA